MDKKIFFIAAVVAALAAVIIYNLYSIVSLKQTVVVNNLPVKVKDIAENQIVPEKKDPITPVPVFGLPLEQAEERITKKKFGQYITSQNSPVQPEKFRGYHTGTDFEIFLEELNANVPVQAICDGKIALKKTATGYGGILVENCELDNQLITVIYGHLKLASIAKKAGDTLAKGEEIWEKLSVRKQAASENICIWGFTRDRQSTSEDMCKKKQSLQIGLTLLEICFCER